MATPYPTAGPPVPSTPSSKVELHISCKDLIDSDIFSKSDPIVTVSLADKGGSMTEVITHTHTYTHAQTHTHTLTHTHTHTHTLTCAHTHTHTCSQYARTEWIKNTLNPNFSKAIEIEYRFEEVQRLKFSVYDIDNISPTLDDDDFLGSMECTLGEVNGRDWWVWLTQCSQYLQLGRFQPFICPLNLLLGFSVTDASWILVSIIETKCGFSTHSQ